MNEILPIISGLALGAVLQSIRPQRRLPAGVILGVLLALSATILSREYLASWSYVVLDVILVAASAVTCYRLIAASRVRRHRLE